MEIQLSVFKKKKLRGFKKFFEGVQNFFGLFKYLLKKKLFKQKKRPSFQSPIVNQNGESHRNF